MIIEAKKAYNLPSVKWRTKKPNDIVQSESKGLRTGTTNI